MSKVSITRSKLDTLANTISAKAGVAAPLTLDQMAAAVQSIPTGGGIVISDTTDAAGGTVRTITATLISGTKSITQNGTGIDVAEYAAVDVNVSGGTPSATQHVIHFEFTDSTDTDINVYYDDPLISTMITAYEPVTYGAKTVDTAALDNVVWYTRPSWTWETIFNSTAAPNADTPYNYFWLSSLSDVYPSNGSEWRITIAGTEYRLTAATASTSAGTTVCIGNPKYSGGTDNGSPAPFNFTNQGWGALVGDTELSAATPYAIKIERLVTA